jgi:hypothetical protein
MPTEVTQRRITHRKPHVTDVSEVSAEHVNDEKMVTNNSTPQANPYNFGENASFHNLLEESARVAYSRPWHRLERGLRLNRIRIFVDDELSKTYSLSADEKSQIFLFLQRSLDRKLLNTLKVVNYDVASQRINAIKGFALQRTDDGVLKYGFVKRKTLDSTRKKKPIVDESVLTGTKN